MYTLSNDKKYISFENKYILSGFGTKQLGDGRDATVLRHYFKNKIPTFSVVTPKQSHSANIVEYKYNNDLFPNNCDGVVTKVKNVMLTVLTADCLPIIYHDPVTSLIGISHQGWIGTLNRLSSFMIEKMKELGSSVQNIQCICGPAINDCCYDVPLDRVRKLKKVFNRETIFRKDNGKYYLNLYTANYLTLTKKGVLSKNINYFPFCTSCDEGKFYSYRRDKKIIGEMLSFVMLQSGSFSR